MYTDTEYPKPTAIAKAITKNDVTINIMVLYSLLQDIKIISLFQ